MSEQPTLPAFGTELRAVVGHLEVLASHVRVCTNALEGKAADDDLDVAVVLRETIGTSLYSQTHRLARLAARCDGLPVGEEYMEGGTP